MRILKKKFSQEKIVRVMRDSKKIKLHMIVMSMESSQSLLWMLRPLRVGLSNLILMEMRI
jgi:hypothetical protein